MIGKMDFTNVNSFINHTDSNNIIVMSDKKAHKEETQIQDDKAAGIAEVTNLNKEHTQNVIEKMKLKKNNNNVSQKDLVDFIKSTSPIEIYETDSDADKAVKKIKKAVGNIAEYVGIARVMIDGKYTIWGKATGADKTISESEIAKANEIFVNYGVDFTSQRGHELLESTELSLSEFIKQYESHMLSRHDNFFMDTRIKLADGGLMADYSKLQTKSSGFKPIQAVSKNIETYDIYKDQKFAYKRQLLKHEQEKGMDVLRLMQKLEENSKKIIDKKV